MLPASLASIHSKPPGELSRCHICGMAGANSVEFDRNAAYPVIDLMPDQKVEHIRKLVGQYTHVGMIGDGVNDAPALAIASVGFAMGAIGSDTAIEAASIAILNDRLELIPFLIRLGRKTISTIRINTAAAVLIKVVFVTLAVFGLSSLALAIFADVGVTVLVILNSLRLLNFE